MHHAEVKIPLTKQQRFQTQGPHLVHFARNQRHLLDVSHLAEETATGDAGDAAGVRNDRKGVGGVVTDSSPSHYSPLSPRPSREARHA